MILTAPMVMHRSLAPPSGRGGSPTGLTERAMAGLFTLSVKNQRFLPSSPRGGAKAVGRFYNSLNRQEVSA